MKKSSYYAEQFFLLLAHLLLLAWMLMALSEGGRLSTTMMIFHFLGMAIYGGLLIRVSAYLAHRRYQKENQDPQNGK